MSLDKAIEMMGEGYLSNEEITDAIARKLGLSPCEVLAEEERRKEILENLQTILSCLTPQQAKVLELTAIGYTVREIGEMMSTDHSAVVRSRQSISKKLFKVADEKRICFLGSEIAKIQSKGKKSKKLDALLDEYEQRVSVRESLKKLFVLLTPPESQKEMTGKTSLPAYTFEREMEVGTGMREGIENGYHVMKTTSECHVPEYLKECFGDKYTCCMLCATCRRKKDVVGRGNMGIWKTE